MGALLKPYICSIVLAGSLIPSTTEDTEVTLRASEGGLTPRLAHSQILQLGAGGRRVGHTDLIHRWCGRIFHLSETRIVSIGGFWGGGGGLGEGEEGDGGVLGGAPGEGGFAIYGVCYVSDRGALP